MKISVAQTRSIKGDIPANIDIHLRLIELSCRHNSDAIFFPELSLTGYEPELAKELATNQDDGRLDVFQRVSNANKITIGVGLPAKTRAGVQISMTVFEPDKVRQTYSKQQLHSDELPYFAQGDRQIILKVKDKKIAPAICYESLQPEHAEKAVKFGAEIYLASVAKSQNGIDKALIRFPEVAKKYSMPVLMANCVGFCDNFQSVGTSSAWTKQGELAGQLDDENQGVLIFDTETEEIVICNI